LAFDTPAVGSKVARGLKAPDIPDFQHDRQPQDLADARHRQHDLKLGSQRDLRQNRLFDGSNLLGQKADGLYMAAGGKAQLDI